MGLFNRNKQDKRTPAEPAASTLATLPKPSTPPRQSGDAMSVYSETTKSTEKSNTYHPDEDPIHEDEDEDFDEEEAHKATTWDEGGASHCGYAEPIHDTLMKVGASVHKVVGEPPQFLEKRMNTVANWFQEMSYAVRDFMRGESKMTEDIADVMNSVMQEHEGEDGAHHDDDEPDDNPTSDTTPAVTAN
jgi:hypothetical protein